MGPKRTASSESEQKQDPKVVQKLRRSERLEKNAAATQKEGPKPQKRGRKSSPLKKPQLKEKITQEETAPAQNGETKPDKEQKTESANDQNA
ncbi:high mobility group nucleosome-binding domain-containing protein 3 isoform X2 [Narcine bancroftii]|uniref:high mobility group nucleosome-binding domain-containing protein 3 isoform X2 n=1 Tax=Narcine bancroftii TaxID=1343680 RepID=UPI003831A55D